MKKFVLLSLDLLLITLFVVASVASIVWLCRFIFEG